MSGKIDENLLLTSSKFIKQKEYWLNKLSGDIRETRLLFWAEEEAETGDYKEGAKILIPPGISSRLIAMGKQSDLSLYIILLTALKTLIYRYNSQEDIIVISPLLEENMSDKLINQCLFIRDNVDQRETFKCLLFKVRQSVLEAYGNQDYPYLKLLEFLFKARQIQNEEPLSNICCILKNIHGSNHGEYLKHTLTFSFSRENNSLRGEIFYPANGFETGFIKNISRYFNSILAQAVNDITITLSDIFFLPEEEKRQILFDFNCTQAIYPSDKTIYGLFREQAERNPDHICLNSLEYTSSGKCKKISLTYKELERQANRLSRVLIGRGTDLGTIIGLMVVPSAHMIVGILGILQAGGAYMPINPEFPPDRINYMLADSKALLLLAETSLLSINFPDIDGDIIPLDTLTGRGEEWGEPNLVTNSSDLLYVIYTSGSTGKPKGVMVENGNLENYVNWFGKETHLTERDRTALTSSFAYDLGYTALYPSILNGGQLNLLPREIYGEAEQLIDFIHRSDISYIKVTPSLFSIIVASNAFDVKNCSSLRLVVLGGEEIIPGDIEKAHRLCPNLRIMNHYGPTEATVGCIAAVVDWHRFGIYIKNPTIGKPIYNTNAYILDKDLNILPVGVPGELYIAGDGVSRGYMNNPELTGEKYKLTVLHHLPSVPGSSNKSRLFPFSRFYKTGDLAKWMPDGNIKFLGRSDHQVKIRGYRIELGEIKNKLENYSHIKEAIVAVKTHGTTGKYLCAYFLSDPESTVSVSQLKEYLNGTLPGYMVPSYFIQLEKWRLTPNGKIDRHALPEPEPGTSGDEYVAPTNEIERKLLHIWSDILAIPKEKIGVHSNFFELGGHSLNATMLGARIHKVLNVKVPLADIFHTPTIKGIADYIKASVQDQFLSMEPAEKKEYYRLSSAQKRLYFLHRLDPDSTAYNIPAAIIMENTLDETKLKDAFKTLIHRHESLRTSFLMMGDEPVQKIHPQVEFAVEFYEVSESKLNFSDSFTVLQERMIIKNFIRPFDLSRTPLVRVGVIRGKGQKDILIIDMYHIISDGVSMSLLNREFRKIYERETLAALRIQYKDFAGWQNRLFESEEMKKQEEYWLKEFQKKIPLLNLPIDYPRPENRDAEGDMASFQLSPEDSRLLKQMSIKEEATLYIVLLAIFNVFLAKICRQEDIVVGSVIAGRGCADLDQVIGPFINILPMRNYPVGKKTFAEFLREVKEVTLKAFENQDYPFEELVAKIASKRDLNRCPISDVGFTIQNVDQVIIDMSAPLLKPEMIRSHIDFNLMGMEIGEIITFNLEYCLKLFKSETIARFITYFKTIAAEVIKFPGKKIEEIDMIPEDEEINYCLRVQPAEESFAVEFDM